MRQYIWVEPGEKLTIIAREKDSKKVRAAVKRDYSGKLADGQISPAFYDRVVNLVTKGIIYDSILLADSVPSGVITIVSGVNVKTTKFSGDM